MLKWEINRQITKIQKNKKVELLLKRKAVKPIIKIRKIAVEYKLIFMYLLLNLI